MVCGYAQQGADTLVLLFHKNGFVKLARSEWPSMSNENASILALATEISAWITSILVKATSNCSSGLWGFSLGRWSEPCRSRVFLWEWCQAARPDCDDSRTRKDKQEHLSSYNISRTDVYCNTSERSLVKRLGIGSFLYLIWSPAYGLIGEYWSPTGIISIRSMVQGINDDEQRP